MPRPRKSGLEDMFRSTSLDDKEEELRTIHGNDGWTALQLIYMNCWQRGCPEFDLSNDAKVGTLARKALVTVEKLREMIATMVEVGLFDPDEYLDRKVLTSDGLCRRISAVLRKRDNNRQVSDEFQPPKPDSNSTETRLLLDPTVHVHLDHTKDLDLEEGSGGSGGNEPSTELAVVPDGRKLRGKFVSLSDAEIDKLEKHRIATTQTHCSPREFVEIAIERVDASFGSTPKRRKESRTQDHYLCIVRWGFDAALEHLTRIARSNRESSYAKKASGPDIPRHIQQSINYTDALLAEARRLDAEDEKQKKLMVN